MSVSTVLAVWFNIGPHTRTHALTHSLTRARTRTRARAHKHTHTHIHAELGAGALSPHAFSLHRQLDFQYTTPTFNLC